MRQVTAVDGFRLAYDRPHAVRAYHFAPVEAPEEFAAAVAAAAR